MDQYKNICQRLSLRPPQAESLRILTDIMRWHEECGTDDALLQRIQQEYASVTSFDRDFPSLCFALATGVGKTRLMGAFIAWLHLERGLNDFLVLAPNLTIYEKLKTDFTAGSPKYVFKGIGELCRKPPYIITGDDFETNPYARGALGTLEEHLRINIFNIAKLTSRDSKNCRLSKDDARRGLPRIRRLSEYLGTSYFDYLSGLDDLVLIMDESHRYRAAAGMETLNELHPLLGLELTATPQVEQGKQSHRFGNVIYEYPLSQAIADGFVKEPAVVTRLDFDPAQSTPEEIERIKLEDGLQVHENTRVALLTYAGDKNRPRVKPFVLVIAGDIEHAQRLQELLEGPNVCEGRYKGKVLIVHSKAKSGSEGEEIIQRLLTVEDPENPVEIVIHVNMLKEGWDVTNLYTIIPLRAANSRTLVEQSIGRGLRLPYGQRTGCDAVDRLNIIAHDRFQEIIDDAGKADSVFKKGLVIGRDLPDTRLAAVTVPSLAETVLGGEDAKIDNVSAMPDSPQESAPAHSPSPQEEPLTLVQQTTRRAAETFASERDKAIASRTLAEIKRCESRKSSAELRSPEMQRRILQAVAASLPKEQLSMLPASETGAPTLADKVLAATEIYCALTIDIPRVIVMPEGEVRSYYDDFELDCSSVNVQPVAEAILVQHLQSQRKEQLQATLTFQTNQRLEDCLVNALMDYVDIDYDQHAGRLYTLASQLVQHLQSYLKTDDKVRNVLQYYQRPLADLIHTQLQQHFHLEAASYTAHVSRGFTALQPCNYTVEKGTPLRNVRDPLAEGEKGNIRKMLFTGFAKALFPIMRFDSNPERLFCLVLENDAQVVKWLRPAANGFHIRYTNERVYSPDFVVQTTSDNWLCEVKRRSDLDDTDVQDKARAAREWCRNASAHTKENGGNPWHYLLMPHDIIKENMTLSGLVNVCSLNP